MTNKWIQRVALALSVLCVSMGTAFADAGTMFGTLMTPNKVAPAQNSLSFVAFVNGSDDVIHTENAFNAALGTGNGFITQNNQGLWLVNFSNFATAKPKDSFSVVFTSKENNLRGVYNGTVPAGLTQADVTVALRPVALPKPASNLQAQRVANGVVVTWNAEPGLRYRVYRANLPSGADNGNSRGIYEKVAQNITGGAFTDTKANANETAWYLVIAENKQGVLSAHSGEVRALPASHFTKGGAVMKNTLQATKFVDGVGEGDLAPPNNAR